MKDGKVLKAWAISDTNGDTDVCGDIFKTKQDALDEWGDYIKAGRARLYKATITLKEAK